MVLTDCASSYVLIISVCLVLALFTIVINGVKKEQNYLTAVIKYSGYVIVCVICTEVIIFSCIFSSTFGMILSIPSYVEGIIAGDSATLSYLNTIMLASVGCRVCLNSLGYLFASICK